MSRSESILPRLALLAAGLVGALAVVSWQLGWLGRGSAEPLPVAQVPSELPTGGVQLEHGAVVLTRWTTTPTGAMPADQAIAVVRRISTRRDSASTPGLLAALRTSFPATALPVEITLPGEWPPGSTVIGPARSIDHIPVWLVTFTSSRPIDASGGALFPFYVTQFSEAVNPITGRLVLGFETPAS